MGISITVMVGVAISGSFTQVLKLSQVYYQSYQVGKGCSVTVSFHL